MFHLVFISITFPSLSSNGCCLIFEIRFSIEPLCVNENEGMISSLPLKVSFASYCRAFAEQKFQHLKKLGII